MAFIKESNPETRMPNPNCRNLLFTQQISLIGSNYQKGLYSIGIKQERLNFGNKFVFKQWSYWDSVYL
ncbi:MAG TPA: hypothetical protein VGQ04_11015, partial [Chitinophagaceae bacterium]|nr:hypothetical protein [Chitinophagaceae bacterium]